MGVQAMADISIASTWGFDQLLPYNISVVEEKRIYSKFNQDNLFEIDGKDPNYRKLSNLNKEEEDYIPLNGNG
jgi:hypothetical protein